jgi:adenylate cyclase
MANFLGTRFTKLRSVLRAFPPLARPLAPPVSLILICALVGIGIAIFGQRPLATLNDTLYDVMLRRCRKAPPLDQRLVFIAISDASLRELNTIDRSHHTELLNGLRRAGAQAVVFDFIFPGPSRIPQEDAALRKAMSEMPTLLAVGATQMGQLPIEWSDRTRDVAGRFAVSDRFGDASALLPHYSVSHPQQQFLDSAFAAGHVMAEPDDDGVFRRVPLLLHFGDRLMPSLALSTALSALRASRDDIEVHKGFIRITINRAGASTSAAQTSSVRTIDIPIDSRGRMLVNYTSNWEEDARWFHDQLIGLKVSSDEMSEGFTGRVVMIAGATSSGGDMVTTPVETSIPGARVLFDAANTILCGTFISQVSSANIAILCGAAPLAMGLVLRLARGRMAVFIIAMAIVSLAITPMLLFRYASLFLPVIAPLLTCALSVIAWSVALLIRDHRQARHGLALLSRFVSAKLAGELQQVASISRLPPPQRKELCILFADIAGSTAFSERVEPEETSGMIARFYEIALAVLNESDGELDKFLGDGVLAYWGDEHSHATLSSTGSAGPAACKEVRAVSGALQLRDRFRQQVGAGLEPSLDLRCGIATGIVTVGYVGGDRHAAYTIIGRTVNLAARLQASGSPGATIVEKRTADRVRGFFELQPRDAMQVKGVDRMVESWEVVRALAEPLPTI